MKKAIKTLFQPQSLKMTLMVVFAWCCLSLPTAFAQDIVITDDGAATHTGNATEVDCDATTSRTFTDDGGLLGNYADASPRVDTVEICPMDPMNRIKVTFTDFDIAPGDTLFAFDGNIDSVRTSADMIGIGSGSGVGTSNFCTFDRATGAKIGTAWITSSCSPLDNPSGCITFIFETDGLNSKGSGWVADVECEERSTVLGDITIPDVVLDCDRATAAFTIPAPQVIACGEPILGPNNVVNFAVTNERGEECFSGTLSSNGSVVGSPDWKLIHLGIGQYSIVYTWPLDPTVTLTKLVSVSEPSLVCNDEVEAPLGAAGSIQFAPDDLLENPCDTISGAMYYNITITLGTGKDEVVLTTTNHDNANAVVYPTITKADIAAAGLDCNGTANVKIERIYYGRGFPTVPHLADCDCDNGVVTASCETTVQFKDLSAPVLNIPAGITEVVACDANGIENIITATATDNFDTDVTITTSVVEHESAPCMGDDNRMLATVTFTATDDCGNATSEDRVFTIIRPSILEKVADESVECNDTYTIPVPSMSTGYMNGATFVRTGSVQLNAVEALESGADPADYVCGYVFLYTEEEIPTTDCGSKTYRYYDLVDWCDSGSGPQRVDTVFVEFTDETAPTFTGEASDQVIAPADIELGAFECTYDVTQHTAPTATDNCGLDEVVLLKVFRIEDGSNWEIEDPADWTQLDCDSFRLMYVARDLCHEQPLEDTTRQIVVIKDVTAPSAVTVDQLNVSVPNDEGALVLVGAIDAGSSDACGIKTREVRRENPDGSYSDWGSGVVITCEDVHEDVTVELRVTDNKDNVDVAWMTITAEDKIPPVCEDLADRTLTCKDIHTGELGASTDADNDGFEDSEWAPLEGDLLEVYNTRFGLPNCTDNLSCGDLTYVQEYQLVELDCGELMAKRRYRAFDWQGANGNPSGWAEQNITVNYVPEWTLTFPADVDLTCADAGNVPAPATAADVIGNGSCDLWALELVSEDTFEVGNDICMKIERKYEVTNWCRFNAGETASVVPHNAAGTSISHTDANVQNRYVYTQVIKLYVTEAPTVTINDVETCIIGVGDALPYNEEDQNLGAAPFECDDIRTFSASATNCVGAQLSDFTYKVYVDGVLVEPDGVGADFTWIVQPKVEYTVEFWANDGCGNSAGETRTFEFWDCKKPTPYVLNGIAVDLGQDGTVEVWANDLDQGSFDNCTDQADLEMYITIGELTDIVSTVEEVRALGSNVEFTCNDIGRTNVLIYVVDAEGNWDVVGTYVSVGGNGDNCIVVQDPSGMVAGHIVTPLGENVEQVVVSVAGAMQESMMTTADGTFQFELNPGADYTVTPVKDTNPLNGVSTFDLVLISKHILGITPFDSPYKYVAADVNKSGTVTAFDMVQVRQLILNIRTEFPQNDSWRFVDAKHDFAASTTNPAAQNFGEFMDISQLSSSMMDVDFVGIKIGDINGNAAANSLLGAESRTTTGALTFNVADRFVEAGETVTVDFTSANIAAAQGYQFTMNFSGLTFNKLEEGVAKAANFNTNLAERGVITTSWNGEATAEDALFSLTFNATTSGLLSDLMTVSSDLTPAEAYNTDGELLDVNIEFSTAVVAEGFELGQNIPNPFNGETVIGFNLPNAGSATLTVMNIQGKVLQEIKGDYAKGYNTIVLKASDLATGVLHYQLESADQVATRKMIIID